jgi:plastocyanin
MRGIHRASGALAAAALLLAACSGGGTGDGGTPTSGSQTAAASVCSEPAAGTAADVEASVGGNTWGPVNAKVGDVITWSNGDAVPHKVGLDDGSCTMSRNITGDAPQSLVFSAAGSYPFHCTVHPSMKGTIVIS